MPPLTKKDYDKLFCKFGKQYGIQKLMLKAVAICESALDERAYRFEKSFWPNKKGRILSLFPELEAVAEEHGLGYISASYGLMQIMFTTGWGLGLRGTDEDLYNPVYNIQLGAKLLRNNKLGIITSGTWRDTSYEVMDIALARYNGGSRGNPDSNGELRNIKYVKKVRRVLCDLRKHEKECEDD